MKHLLLVVLLTMTAFLACRNPVAPRPLHKEVQHGGCAMGSCKGSGMPSR